MNVNNVKKIIEETGHSFEEGVVDAKHSLAEVKQAAIELKQSAAETAANTKDYVASSAQTVAHKFDDVKEGAGQIAQQLVKSTVDVKKVATGEKNPTPTTHHDSNDRIQVQSTTTYNTQQPYKTKQLDDRI